MGRNAFDVIIVGAGPAGTTAALLLAGKGFKVALIERGEYPGAKNMFGGVLYGKVLSEIIPEYWLKAPVERFVNRKIITLLAENSSVSLDFNSSEYKTPPYNGFVVHRSLFDRWYAQQAVNAGALLITQTKVENIVREGNQVVGVVTDKTQGILKGKVVIAADGAVSLLANKAGLRRPFTPEQFSLGVKEVIQLPPGVMEERFGLTGDEGLSNEYLGLMGDGLHGGAFLYTTRYGLSIGVVAQLHSLKATKATIYEALEKFKRHPSIAPLISDGRFYEYSAHIIPEAGVKMIPKLYTGGMLVTGDAAGFVLAGGIFLEGVNFAVASGRIAAETVSAAFEKGNFSEGALAEYETKLNESFVLKDINKYKDALPMLMNKRLYEVYPSMICRSLEKWFRVDGKGHPKLSSIAKEYLGKEVGIWEAIKDGYQMGRAMIW